MLYPAVVFSCPPQQPPSAQLSCPAFKIKIIYLAAAGLSCGMWDPWSLSQHAGSLVETCELLVAACMWNLVPLPRIEPGLPGSRIEPPGKSLDAYCSKDRELAKTVGPSLCGGSEHVQVPVLSKRVQVAEDPAAGERGSN